MSDIDMVERVARAIAKEMDVNFEKNKSAFVRYAHAAIEASDTVLVKALHEAALQLEYMQERMPTGTSAAVLARINHLLDPVEGGQ